MSYKEAKSCDWTDAWRIHEPSNLGIIAGQSHHLAIEIVDLLLDSVARIEQRPDRSHQLGTTLNQLLSSYGEEIEFGTADAETKVLEQAADLVLDIALYLNQQRPTCQQSFNVMAVRDP